MAKVTHQLVTKPLRSSTSAKSPSASASRSIPSLTRRANFLEQWLVESHTTVTIPFDDRVIFVSLLNCAEFSSRLSEVS
jgi:hypothetical protein